MNHLKLSLLLVIAIIFQAFPMSIEESYCRTKEELFQEAIAASTLNKRLLNNNQQSSYHIGSIGYLGNAEIDLITACFYKPESAKPVIYQWNTKEHTLLTGYLSSNSAYGFLNSTGNTLIEASKNERGESVIMETNIYTKESKELLNIGSVNISSFACNSDSSSIAISSFCKVAIYNKKTGKLTELKHQAYISNIIYSPDGSSLVTYSKEGNISYLWGDIEGSPKMISMFSGPVLAYRPDSAELAIKIDQNLVVLYDTKRGKLIGSCACLGISSASYDPTGVQLAMGSDAGGIYCWNVAANKTTTLLSANNLSSIKAVIFLANGNKVVAWSSGIKGNELINIDMNKLRTLSHQIENLTANDVALITAKKYEIKSLLTGFSPELQSVIRRWKQKKLKNKSWSF